MKRRRSVSIFGLSFLDVMFCGFGSVILLVMIVNAETVERREVVHTDLRAEVDARQREALTGRRELVALRTTLASTQEEAQRAEAAARSALAAIVRTREDLARLDAETLARIESVNSLKSDLKKLDEETRRLSAEAQQASAHGQNVRRFQGEGDRQYLTGLRIGGKRILILVDTSASMLAGTVVNVVRLRNMEVAEQRRARKWRRALRTVEWLVSQLPRSSSFQIYRFNTRAEAVLKASEGQWLKAGDGGSLNAAVTALRQVVPADGTSLHRAFEAIERLQPAPDNVILLTDGLPTQGRNKPSGTTVTANQRLKHFASAVSGLSTRVPMNIILFPMEGDPLAAAEFWKLAAVTQGSFITPSKDWP